MASTPEANPDSLPPERPGSIEQVDDFSGDRHEDANVDSPMADPGTDGGTAGTGDNKVQDELAR